MPARFGTVLGVLLLAGFGLFSYSVKRALLKEISPLDSLHIGQPMPDFSVPDGAGRPLVLSDITKRNRLVLVNFWASWCGPCRIEMPEFERVYRAKKGAGFTILAIDEDDDPGKLAAYLKAKPVSFPIARDPQQKIAERFGIRAFPTSILISQGSIVKVTEGITPYLESMVDMNLGGTQWKIVNKVEAQGSPAQK